MADVPADLDITTDLNAQGDVQPYHGDALPSNQVPAFTPEPKQDDPAQDKTSLRDLLSNAFKGDPATAKPDQQTQQPAADPSQPLTTATPATPAPSDLVKVGDRWHNKDGTFASKEQIDAHNAALAAGTGQPAAVTVPEYMATQLTPTEVAQYTALPAEIRQFVDRTMESVQQRVTQLSEYETLERELLGPRRQAWASQGMNPAVALNQLFQLSDFAGRDPGQFVMWFADQHRIDLDTLLDERDAALQNGGQVDPRYVGLQQEISQLRNAISGLTNVNVNAQLAQGMQAVQAFTDEKDAQGNLAHPYFAEVATVMQQHAATIRAQQPLLNEREVLKAAYDFACYNNPTVRGRMQEAQAQALKDNAAAEAARARQAGVSINGGPAADAGVQPNNTNRSLREELQNAYHQSTLQ